MDYSLSSISTLRNRAILAGFRKLILEAPFVSLDDIARKLVDSPSPRFWVSEERATFVVSAMIRNPNYADSMRPSKREMFSEILRRVKILKSVHPNWHLCRIVAEVIDSPAPKFYIAPSSAKEYFFKARSEARRNNRKPIPPHKP